MSLVKFQREPAGKWNEAAARGIIELLNSEQDDLLFGMIDVTTFQDAEHMFYIVARCKRHDRIIERDSVCGACLAELPREGIRLEGTGRS